jgi:hypothetical protein
MLTTYVPGIKHKLLTTNWLLFAGCEKNYFTLLFTIDKTAFLPKGLLTKSVWLCNGLGYILKY